ncbi:hypothetical protein TNCT_353511 [Trichonephila clavata]|uniref:Uncharacterized protein n=1 Tax=Trichonephila clavata TaxID=2740835 RepID=A0A8X6LYL0_TRICU|nr:hypothetical protein TNCT_353511 [Trichonephila clavata]
MAVYFIFETVLHLFQYALYYAFGFDIRSFYEICLFEVAVEIIKNCKVKEQPIPRSVIETSTPSKPVIMTNTNNTIPVVRSATVYHICQALELDAILVPSDDSNPEVIQTPSRKVKQAASNPVVYSYTLLKICEALNLKVELRPENEKPVFVNSKRRQVPVVHSLPVFLLCEALQLDAQLAAVSL